MTPLQDFDSLITDQPADEDLYIVIDLTSDDALSWRFLSQHFPYGRGDRCVFLDLAQALAVIRVARLMASQDQLDTLRSTSAIVGYAFKGREEIEQYLWPPEQHALVREEVAV